MNKEQYITYETAQLLKDKGFDWECRSFYEYFSSMITMYQGMLPELSEAASNFNNKGSDICSRPTQQMACRWLREEHKIHITAEPLEMFKQERIVYEPIIYLLNDFDDFALEYKTVHLKECDTNEYAIEVALQYCLTNLI